MKLSATEEYGLRCLIQVHRLENGAPVRIQDIAAAEGMSSDYAAKILRSLREAELLTSTRGTNGGYRLARPASSITVLQIISALDGPLVDDAWCVRHAGQHDTCVHSADCSVQALWTFIGGTLEDALGAVTLADLTGGRLHVLNLLRGLPSDRSRAVPSPAAHAEASEP